MLVTTALVGLGLSDAVTAADLVVNGVTDENTVNIHDNVTVFTDGRLNIGPSTNVTTTANLVTTVQGAGQLKVFAGSTYVADGAVFSSSSGIIEVSAGGNFEANSTTTLTDGRIYAKGGTYTANGLTALTGRLDNLAVTNSGTYTANGDTVLSGGGILEVYDGGTYNAGGATTITYGSLSLNYGSLYTATGNITLNGEFAFLAHYQGTVQANGNVYLQNGAITVGKTFNAAVLTSISGGKMEVLVGGTYTATGATVLSGGALVINGTYNANGGLAGSDGTDDTLTVRGSLNLTGDVLFGTGNDLVTLHIGAEITPGHVLDGGGDTDTIVLAGKGTGTEDMSRFRNFEIIEKKDAGFWTLLGGSADEPATVQSITIDAGSLVLLGVWNVAGNTTTVLAGTNLTIGDGGTESVLNEDGDLNVFGQLDIGNNGAVTVGGTTIIDSANLNVDAGATFTAKGPLITTGSGSLYVAGSARAESTTSIGAHLRLQGTFDALGPVLVTGSITLEAPPDGTVTFTAYDTTTISGTGALQVSREGSVYRSMGALTVEDSANVTILGKGALVVDGTTTISGDGLLFLRSGGRLDAAGPVVLTGGWLFAGVDYTDGSGDTQNGGVLAGSVDNRAGTAGGFSIYWQAQNDAIRTGTLKIVGAYQQGTGGTFLAGVIGGGESDLLIVEGTTTLAGRVAVVVLGGAFTLGDQVRLIATDNGIKGMFDTAALSGAPIGNHTAVVLKTNDAGALSPDGNNIDLLFIPSGVQMTELSGNKRAIAAILGTALPPGEIVVQSDTVMAALYATTAQAVLDQVSPEPYDSFTSFSFDVARQYGGLIDRRVRGLRGAGGGGGSGEGLVASDPRTPTLIADAAGGPGPKTTGGTAPGYSNGIGPRPSGWSVWASGIGSGLWLNQSADNLGYSGWTTGGAAGVDLRLHRGFVVGVLAGGTRSNIDFDGVSGDGDMESVTTGVYAAWVGRRLFANTAFTYTRNWIEADRDITAVGTTATGKTEGDQYAVHATVGVGFRLRRLSVEASGGVDWVKLIQNGFTETGAGALNLTVDGRSDDSLRLRAGVRFARAFRLRPGFVLAPSVRVGYAREVLDNTRPITASLAGVGGSFTVTGDEGGRDFVTYGGGVQAKWSQGLTLYFDYAGEWATDRTASTFSGGLKVNW